MQIINAKETAKATAEDSVDPIGDIWDEFYQVILSGGVDADTAELAVAALHARYGGSRIGYLPKKRKAQRKQVIRECNGKNHKQIASKYQLSLQTVYNEIRRYTVNIR